LTPYAFPFEVQYGFHFNAGLLGEFLRKKGVARGIQCREAHVEDVVLTDDGEVSHLLTKDGERLEADFFVDCSGFGSLITGKALETPFESYADALFNDRAVTLLTDAEAEASTQTVSAALGNGWAWRIPLRDRVGNGYVYSSRHCSEEQAEAELRRYLGLAPGLGEARHLSMRVGRAATFWNRNTLAVGLSQGFLEPLEATALALVQLTVTQFARLYTAGNGSDQHADTFNQVIAAAFDGVKDYIHTHFLTTDREDTPYWRDCRHNQGAASGRLLHVLDTWNRMGDLDEALKSTGLNRHYKLNSWLYILSGMGLFPPADKLAPASQQELKLVPMDSIREFFERLTLNHVSQQEAFGLMQMGNQPFADSRRSQVSGDEALARLLGLDFAVSA
jgi:hypothetical protein